MSGSSQLLNSSNWYLGSVSQLTSDLRSSFDRESRFIVTANLESVAMCKRDSEFLNTCLSANILVPDGIGSVILLKRFGRKVIERIPGIELTENILKSSEPSTKVFLFGAKNTIVKKASELVENKFPNVEVVGFMSGYEFDDDTLIDSINKSNAEILLVALGIPKQEFWILRNRSQLKNIKLFIGVGGVFDVWAGSKKRAPAWMCRIGLEWLWRALVEPFVRIPRLFKSLGVFIPLLILGR
ncbi:MAG: WecB/TagA/CpsF family glycosyltransferase [Caldisericia bacterium]|nr:WecB/TagA/CpsF family glycosyltransferase [Caldisericia bacterium]